MEGWLETLFRAQTEQANTICLTSWPMEGHQNCWRMAASDINIKLNICGPGQVQKGEVELVKKECPASLARAQPLGRMDIF